MNILRGLRRAPWLAVALLGAGCVGPSGPVVSYAVERERVAAGSFGDVWDALLDTLSDSPLQIRGIDRQSGVLYAEGLIDPALGWADCGRPGWWHPQDQIAIVNVYVRDAAPGTRVLVNARFQRLYSSGGDRRLVQCTSTGALERDLLAAAG